MIKHCPRCFPEPLLDIEQIGNDMTLRFTLLGFELARVELDIEREQETPLESVLDDGIKLVSKQWIKRLFR